MGDPGKQISQITAGDPCDLLSLGPGRGCLQPVNLILNPLVSNQKKLADSRRERQGRQFENDPPHPLVKRAPRSPSHCVIIYTSMAEQEEQSKSPRQCHRNLFNQSLWLLTILVFTESSSGVGYAPANIRSTYMDLNVRPSELNPDAPAMSVSATVVHDHVQDVLKTFTGNETLIIERLTPSKTDRLKRAWGKVKFAGNIKDLLMTSAVITMPPGPYPQAGFLYDVELKEQREMARPTGLQRRNAQLAEEYDRRVAAVRAERQAQRDAEAAAAAEQDAMEGIEEAADGQHNPPQNMPPPPPEGAHAQNQAHAGAQYEVDIAAAVREAVEQQMRLVREQAAQDLQHLQSERAAEAQALRQLIDDGQNQLLAAQRERDQAQQELEERVQAQEDAAQKMVKALDAEKREAARLRKERDQARSEHDGDHKVSGCKTGNAFVNEPLTDTHALPALRFAHHPQAVAEDLQAAAPVTLTPTCPAHKCPRIRNDGSPTMTSRRPPPASSQRINISLYKLLPLKSVCPGTQTSLAPQNNALRFEQLNENKHQKYIRPIAVKARTTSLITRELGKLLIIGVTILKCSALTYLYLWHQHEGVHSALQPKRWRQSRVELCLPICAGGAVLNTPGTWGTILLVLVGISLLRSTNTGKRHTRGKSVRTPRVTLHSSPSQHTKAWAQNTQCHLTCESLNSDCEQPCTPRSFGRGGAMEPGKPSQHRYWRVQRPAAELDSHMRQQQRALKLIQATKVYNPPGDGLCFWYALAHSLWPHTVTHYDKLKQALTAQRRTIAYVRGQLNDPASKQDLLVAFRAAVEIGEDGSEIALRSQLTHLESHPQEYMLAVNDLLRNACGLALQCEVHWWAVHQPTKRAPTIDRTIWGAGRPVHVFYDHQAKHYLAILEFTHSQPYLGEESFQDFDAPLWPAECDTDIQCAASWAVACEMKIHWADCPWWVSAPNQITYRKEGLSKKLVNGWQEYVETKCCMTPGEAKRWNSKPMPQCPLTDPPHAIPHTNEHMPSAHAPITQIAPCIPHSVPELSNGQNSPARPRSDPRTETVRTHAQSHQDRRRARKRTESKLGTSQVDAAGKHNDSTPEWVEAEHEQPHTSVTAQLGAAMPSLQRVCMQAPLVGRPLQIVTINMRSSAEMYKVHHLLYRLGDIPANVDVVVAVQETWLRSSQARQAIRQVSAGPGWSAAALDRSLPDETRSGGIMMLIRAGQKDNDKNNHMYVRHQIIDTVGVMCTCIHRARSEDGRRDATETTAIMNAYVPTGQNRLSPAREQQLTDRVMGAARHAGEHSARVIVTGDWNHLTQEWISALRTMGYQLTAQAGVEIIMVKSQTKPLTNCRCEEVCDPTSELFTDHPLLSTILPQANCTDAHTCDTRINTDLVAAHGEEFRALLTARLADPSESLTNMTSTQRMRWAAQQITECGHQVTLTHTKPQGTKCMKYPKNIQKLHDKLRGKTPLGAGESKAQLRKRVHRATDRWQRRQFERLLTKRDAGYNTDMQRTFRQLTAPPRESLQIIEEKDANRQHDTAEARDECARRRIGSLWSTNPCVDVTAIADNQTWAPYTRAAPQNTLEGIDAPVSESEILTAFNKMGVGKATQSDHISKELLMQVPAEFKQMFVDYVQATFDSGRVDEEEGLTDVVLLTKKPALGAQEITNKRPISLVKFVTKWVQSILAHRIQSKLQHLDNYGFQKQRSTAAAVRKITAILENARLRGVPAHMLTIDVEKAYDTVPFQLIEHMLCQYRCPPKTLQLIMEMHCKRALRFKIEGHIGSPIAPQRGVAQGSPLSCILFVLCMQPLLLRLHNTATGVWGPQDDVAYVDDLTLLAPTAQALEQKWEAVRQFEQWSGMKINIAKCEYDTTEQDPSRWADIPGVKNMRAITPDTKAVRVLGYWLNAEGDRTDQIQRIVTSIRVATGHMTRKLISPEIAKGIINMILSARLNYTAQNNEIPPADQNKILDACKTLAKQQYGFARPSITAKLFTHQTAGGMGLENPQNVADRATVTEYVMALNSEREKYTADIMRDNMCRIDDIAHNIKPVQRRIGKAVHTIACLSHQKTGGSCTCHKIAYQDMQYAQAGRSAARLGVTIQSCAQYETALKALTCDQERAKYNGKKPLLPGEYLHLTHKQSGEERCAVYYEEIRNEGKPFLGLTWLPKLQYVKSPQERTTIVGDNAQHEKSGIKLDKCYITAAALEKAYRCKTIKPTEILRRLSQQWQPERRITTLGQVPGILTTWVEDPADWQIRRAHMSLTSLQVARTHKGRHRKWDIDIRTLDTVESAEMEIGHNDAYKVKQELKQLLTEEAVCQVAVWTDGTKQADGHESKFGCGIHVEIEGHHPIDLACRITGVSSVLGAEITPVVKLMKWSDQSKQIVIHTDSQATIDAWKRLTTQGYADRELTNHAERNAIYALQRLIRQKPELTKNIQFKKVVSHTGDVNNECADLLAGLGAAGEHAIWIHLRSGQTFQLVDRQGTALLGNLRKKLRKEDQDRQNEKWRASTGPQGEFARAIKKHGLRRQAGPQRTIMSHKKYLREINSIQQQQHKWEYGSAAEAKPEFMCPACQAPFNSAAHRLYACSENARHLVLARLKHKWTNRQTPPQPGHAPKWVTALTAKRTPAHKAAVQLTMGTVWGACRRHAARLRKAPSELTRTEQEQFENEIVVAQASLRTKLLRREHITKWQTGSALHIRERVENAVLPPKWLTRALLPLGIYTELTDNALTNAGWLEAEEVDGQATPQKMDSLAVQGGGVFRSMLNASPAEVKEHSRDLLTTLQRANQGRKLLRYTILAEGDAQMRKYVKSNGGKILAVWGKSQMKLHYTASVFAHHEDRTTCNAAPLFLAMWETNKMDEAWGVPEDFWNTILKWNRLDGNQTPELRESRGLTKQKEQSSTRDQEPETEHGEEDAWDHPLWDELQQLEQTEPQLLWASRIPTLQSQPDFRPEVPKLRKTHVCVTVKIGQVTLERRMPTDAIKLPENVELRKEFIQAKKEAKMRVLQWYAALETDIWTHRRDLHILQGKLLQTMQVQTPPERSLAASRQQPRNCKRHLRNGLDKPIIKKPKLTQPNQGEGKGNKRKCAVLRCQASPRVTKPRLAHETVQTTLDQPIIRRPPRESETSRHARIKLEKYRYTGTKKRTREQSFQLLDSYKYKNSRQRVNPP